MQDPNGVLQPLPPPLSGNIVRARDVAGSRSFMQAPRAPKPPADPWARPPLTHSAAPPPPPAVVWPATDGVPVQPQVAVAPLPLDEYRKRLVDIYTAHKPENVPKVDHLLSKYANQEYFLYETVCQKYGIDPARGLEPTPKAFTKAKGGAPFSAPTTFSMSDKVQEWDSATGQMVTVSAEPEDWLLEALGQSAPPPQQPPPPPVRTAVPPPPLRVVAPPESGAFGVPTNGSMAAPRVVPPPPAHFFPAQPPVLTMPAMQPSFSMASALVAQPPVLTMPAMPPAPPQLTMPVTPAYAQTQPPLLTMPSMAPPQPPMRAIAPLALAAPRSQVEEDEEYDPFSTEPNNGASALRDPRTAMAEVDMLLLGENSGFFAPPRLSAASVIASASSLPPPDSRAATPQSSTPGEAVSASGAAPAPWEMSRRRRRIDSKPPVPEGAVAAAVPMGPEAVAAYEAALLAQSVPLPVQTVDLLDSDDEGAVSAATATAAVASTAPVAVVAAATAVAQAAVPQVAPPSARQLRLAAAAKTGNVDVVLDLLESDDEAAPEDVPAVPAQEVPAAADALGSAEEARIAQAAELRRQIAEAEALLPAEAASDVFTAEELLSIAAEAAPEAPVAMTAEVSMMDEEAAAGEGETVAGDVYMDPYLAGGDVGEDAYMEAAEAPPTDAVTATALRAAGAEVPVEAAGAEEDARSSSYETCSTTDEDEGLDSVFAEAAKAIK